jgi:hypothetical protein
MTRLLAIALSALLLSGCIAEWKSDRTGPRWNDQPNASNPQPYGGGVVVNPESHSGPGGPRP